MVLCRACRKRQTKWIFSVLSEKDRQNGLFHFLQRKTDKMVFFRTCERKWSFAVLAEKGRESGLLPYLQRQTSKMVFRRTCCASGDPEGRTPDHVESMQGLLVVAILTLLEHFKIRCTREGSSPLLTYSSAVACMCVYG